MSFLFPAFLAGALAVAIPIVLHFARREAAPRLPFSDIRFLQRVPLMQARRRRIREWLLLALRIAALLLLALAFARPFFDATGLAGRPVTIVAVDRSFSMSLPGRFEQARGAARAAIAEAPPGDLVGLVTFDERARVVAEPAADRAAAVAALARTASGFGATRYGAALAAAARSIGCARTRRNSSPISSGVSRWVSSAAVYGLFRPRPSAAVVPAAAAYATSVSSPSRSSFRSPKLPPLTVRVAAVRCIERASGLFRHASSSTSRNDAPDVATSRSSSVTVS